MERFGKYDIEKVLGRGAMGLVYKGYDPVIGRRVAIKTVRKELIDPGAEEQSLTRFRNEARAAGRLMHPNIVSIYEYGEDEKNAFIVMEYVDGRELREYLDQRQGVDLAEARAIMTQLLSALQFAHENNVVHRDIKPANLMLTGAGQLKVADFGIARIDTSNLTISGTVIGTPAYMSPEQCMGRELDHRSDLFSSAIVLYELVTGVKPYEGTIESIAYRICNEAAPQPSRVSKVPLPPAMDQMLAHALAKEPERRFQSAREFSEALDRSIAGTPRGAQPGAGGPEEATVPAVRDAPPIARAGAPDEKTLQTLERELAHVVGPIARIMVKRAAAKHATIGEICAELEEGISDPALRVRFVEGGRRIVAAAGGGQATTGGVVAARASGDTRRGAQGIAQDVIDMAAGKLLPYLGPMARVVAKRAAPLAADQREYARMLADHLPADRRAAFLRDMGYAE